MTNVCNGESIIVNKISLKQAGGGHALCHRLPNGVFCPCPCVGEIVGEVHEKAQHSHSTATHGTVMLVALSEHKNDAFPEKLLSAKVACSRPFHCSNPVGIEPESWFRLTSNSAMNSSNPICSGRTPPTLLLEMSK